MARTPKKVKDDSPVHVYPVLGELRHNGEVYDAGDEVEMSEAEAGPLVEGGTLGKFKEPAQAPAKPAAPPAK